MLLAALVFDVPVVADAAFDALARAEFDFDALSLGGALLGVCELAPVLSAAALPADRVFDARGALAERADCVLRAYGDDFAVSRAMVILL